MIFIAVKFPVKPEYADQWIEKTRAFTEATRAEEGNIFFDWFRDPENANEYLLIEAFQDDADVAHVESEHFKRACDEMPKYLLETPEIINTKIPGKTEWDRMAEFRVENN